MSTQKLQLNRIFSLFLMLSLMASMLGVVVRADQGAQAASDPAPAYQDEVPWFDRDWDYRRVVSIASSCGADATGYQVQIHLDAAFGGFDFSKALSDGSDLRFTTGDGVTLIPHWIESWDPAGSSASIWVRLPTLPATGTSVYLYYGNPTPPAETIVETPPTGPWTRAAGNPIVPIDGPADGRSLLAENIVYDAASGHYWMVHANYNDGGVGLVWSDTPTDPASWHWHGTVIYAANAPHILQHEGVWYIFYSDWSGGAPHNLRVASASQIGGPYTYLQEVLTVSEPWEAFRVDEPYVFQRSDGKWVILYMGDPGSTTEQVGYAISDNLLGPYIKYAGNPVLAFGPAGSFDAGTIADPWAIEFHGTYYIGYTVSSTIYSPWQTAIATTMDWETFTKLGVIFPLGPSGAWDAANSFRGAVTRIGDTYVLSYTGDGYQMGTATQPVFQPFPINDPEAVFGFYEGFEGTSLDMAKWRVDDGMISQATVADGALTLTATEAYIKISGLTSSGMDALVEVKARHPQAGITQLISEMGLAAPALNYTVRIADNFHNIEYWERQARADNPGDVWTNMAVPVDSDWHVLRTYRLSPNTAGFQIDDYPAETTTENVPTNNLYPFLMSFGSGNQFIVDWVRVRQYCGAEAVASVGLEEPRPLEGRMTLDKSGDALILSGSTASFTITVTNDGDFDLTNVTVSDALAPDCERTIGDLPVEAVETYTCELANLTADLTNSATANGEAPGGVPVSATDTHFVDVIQPGIAIEIAPGTQTVFTGMAASFDVDVSNTGDQTLENVTVEAPDVPDCARLIGTLAAGSSSSYTCTQADVTTGFTSEVTVTGDPPLGASVFASDSAIVTVRSYEEPAWIAPGWSYRRPVVIASPCTQAIADYQVLVTLDASFEFSKAQADGSDLRFTADDGLTEIPFWIEAWDPIAQSASIWVKVPSLPLSGAVVYLYYGNPDPPDPPLLEMPPTGPWTRAAGNPIVPIGGPADGRSLLAENIVYDAASGHYWMVHANYNDGGVGLVWSDTPTDPASWHWHGTVVEAANAPHLLHYDGKWYIVFSDWSTGWNTTRHSIQIVEATSISGPYTNRTTLLSPEPYTWENWRVDEPYLFQRDDGKWILVYMGDQGDFESGQYYYEQVGYAIADSLLGPYTKFAGNPFLAWGPPGSFDAGTIADPWVVEFNGTYYIGYTVSSTIYSPWQTAVATTTDWETFTKLGVIFPLGPSGAWDAVNAFRGAVTRINDTYVLSYTGDGFQMGTATQPVFMQPPFNEPGIVFPFYDDFNDGTFNTSNWLIDSGAGDQYVEAGGTLTLNSLGSAQGQFAKIVGQSSFGLNTLVEVYARHPQAGQDQMIVETGWMGVGFTGDKVRIADDFHNTTHWERQAALSSTPGDPWTTMATPVDTDWHTLSLYRTSPNTAGFQIDANPPETTTTNVSLNNLPVFLMSFGTGNQFEVDWVRVRSWCGAEATAALGAEQFHNDPPVAVDDSYFTLQGQTLSVPAPGPLGNDSDPNHDPLYWDLLSGPDHGEVTLYTDGAFTYTPDGGYLGPDSFTYSLDDGSGGFDQATVTILVSPGAPTCTTIQRGTSGMVEDSYIWSAMPILDSSTAGVLYTGTRVHATNGPGETRAMVRFGLDDVPQDAWITSATLGMTVFGTNPSQTVSIYRVTTPWSEVTGTTWTALAGAYDSTAWGSLLAQTGAVSADLTELVNAWVDGTFPNYGLMLINTDDQTASTYRSSEFSTISVRPSLEVCYLEMIGPAVSIEVTPATETVSAGASVVYQATAMDAGGYTWDVTADTEFSIQPEAGGSWSEDTYTSEKAGTWLVTASFYGLEDTAELTVQHASATAIELSPAQATLVAGESQAYQVTAEDAYGNTWDATTEITVLAIDAEAGGSWLDNVYTSQNAGQWTVTAFYEALSDTAELTVRPIFKLMLPIIMFTIVTP